MAGVVTIFLKNTRFEGYIPIDTQPQDTQKSPKMFKHMPFCRVSCADRFG